MSALYYVNHSDDYVAHSIIVIILEVDLITWVQILDEAVCISFCLMPLGKI